MLVVPCSLCAVDGSLYIQTDKASLKHAIEGVKDQPLQAAPAPDVVTMGPSCRVLVVDAMAVLQCMNRMPTMQKLSDLQDAFIKRIKSMMVGYHEGRVIFDHYIDQSLKSKTRQRRAVTSTEFEIHKDMKLTMSMKEFLSRKNQE